MKGSCLAVALLVLFSMPTLAGPNAGGTLILHARPSLVLSDGMDYCGQSGLTACDSAVVTLPADPGVPKVFWATAAFPDSSSPRMSVITFGISYDPNKFAILEQHPCGDSQLPMDSWPDPGSGTAVEWNTAQTDRLRDVYWFRGYLYAPSGPDSTLVELIPHPTQAGVFADDASPAAIDTVSTYGQLGFGMEGRLPCPSAGVLEPFGHGEHISVGGGGRDTTALGSPFDQIVDLGSGDIQLWVVGEHLAGPRVTFVYDGQGTLRINDVVVDLLPPGPTVFTDSQLEHLFGNIPRVQELRRSGLTLRGAADAYKSERRAFELTLDRAYSASGIQAVLALLQSSSLVDAVLDSGDDAVRFHYKGELYPGTLMFGKHWFDHVKRSDESARDLVRVVTEAVRVSTHEPVTVYIDHRGDYRREVGPMSDQLRSIYEQVLRTGRTDGLPSSIRPTRLDLLEIIERSRH